MTLKPPFPTQALGYAVTFLANLLDLAWVSRLNLALGVDDRAFLLGLEVVQPIVSRVATMPMFVLAAKLCPPNVEATLFALLMGLSNFGSVIGIYNGVALLSLFGGVAQPRFHNLVPFIATRTLCYVPPLGLVYLLVPHGRPSDPIPSLDLSRDESASLDGRGGDLELATLNPPRGLDPDPDGRALV